jgi:hypothetical protein
MTSITDIPVALFDGPYYGSSDNRTNVTSATATPASFDGVTAYRTIIFKYPGLENNMIPVGFHVILKFTGTDASLYSVKGFVTNGRFSLRLRRFELPSRLASWSRNSSDAGQHLGGYIVLLDGV